jgi:hypothetical protein
MRIYEVVFIVIAVLMVLVYCVLGAFLLLGKVQIATLSYTFNVFFGIAFIVYGVFRGWRVYQKIEEFRN